MKGILGRKVGMTQVFTEDGTVIPVTVVESAGIKVIQKKTIEKDGYNAIQIGFGDIKEKNTTKPLKGHYAKAGVENMRYLREFRVENPDEYEIGQEIKLDIFEQGEKVDVTGTSKGKGFAGNIKRNGHSRGPMSHGSKFKRLRGSLGPSAGMSRVIKGMPAHGHMGCVKRTVQNLEVVRIDVARNAMLIKGAIPGPKKGLVTVKEAIKK